MSELLFLTNFSNIVLTVVPGASVLLGNSKGDGGDLHSNLLVYVRFYTYYVENILHTSLQAGCTFLFYLFYGLKKTVYLHLCSPFF